MTTYFKPTLYVTVLQLLKQDQRYRDSDAKLVSRIWNNELEMIKRTSLKNITAYDLLVEYAEGRMTSPDSITRARRKAQENNPELRGGSYNSRQNEMTEQVKSEIREML